MFSICALSFIYITFVFQGLLQPVSREIITDRMVRSLPEYARLYFVLKTPMLRDLHTFVNMIKQATEYKEYHGNSF